MVLQHTGSFAFIDATGKQASASAAMGLTHGLSLSDFRGADSDTFCLKFFYHMFGLQIGRLDVIGNNDTDVIWSKSGRKFFRISFFVLCSSPFKHQN